MPATGPFLRSLWSLVLLLAACCTAVQAAPTLVITNLPAYGASTPVQGYVTGANPATQAVALFIFVPGYGWVTKPTCDQPLTPIQTDGSWSANIVTGGADATATRIAALLVNTNYDQPCVNGSATLPTNVYAAALAKTVITRPSPGVRFLSFSGYDWWVKTAPDPVGPGPNYFSDSTSNVWTDAAGRLHLRITHLTNAWQCAEILSARSFGEGNYRFELDSSPDSLDQNITLGLFTYSDDPAYTDREIDVECGRWQNPADTNNAQFVVQPFGGAGHLVRYDVPAGITNSTQLFVWQTNRVDFQSQTGSYAPSNNANSSYAFTNATDVPQSGDEVVHLNLWLILGTPPTDNNEAEIVIKSFDFVPLGTPQSAILRNVQSSAPGRFQYDLAVQSDYHYQIQSSPDCTQWETLTNLLATGSMLQFVATNAPSVNSLFYRSVTMP